MVGGATVVIPPQNEAYWESKGVGIFQGWEWTFYNAGATEISEEGIPVGEIYWDTVTCGLENGPDPLFGFKVSVRGYSETITATPVYGPPDPDTGVAPIIDTIWNGTRTYPPQTDVTVKFTNEQSRIPPLWPRPADLITPDMQNWQNEVFENQEDQFSTVVVPRRFEGITLYGSDMEVSDGNNPVIVGIAEGEARCVGFIENKDVLDVNFMPPGDYYVALDTLIGYIRTPDDRIEPLVNNNTDDPPGVMIAIVPDAEGNRIAGRITFPDELPRSTPQNPIAVGTTYVQQEGWSDSFTVPFQGFVGRHLWVYMGVEVPDGNGNRIQDRFGEEIEDFRWKRSQRPEQVSGYNYVLVFDQSEFAYIERLSGPYTPEIFPKNPAATGEWFPTEPFDPDADPPLYPYDTIYQFVPDGREMIDVHYSISVSGSPAGAETKGVSQTVLAPTRDWQKMLKALLARAYYTNDLSRSYALEPGYCNPDSPNYGGDLQDPYCMVEDDFIQQAIERWKEEEENR